MCLNKKFLSHFCLVPLGICLLQSPQLLCQQKKYTLPPAEFFHTRNIAHLTIQPGDTLVIASYYNVELGRTVKVREDGKISLPLLQGFQAAGLSPEQLQQELTTAYSHEFTRPAITVDLVSPANNAVYVTGEVSLPGPKEIHGRMTIAMALASAQVENKTGKATSTFLIRAAQEGHYNVYKIDASFPAGEARNIEVAPGDVLFIPKKNIAKADDFIDLWVRQLLPATPTMGTTVLFTPGNTATIAAASK